MNVLEKFHGKNLENCLLFDKYFKQINTIKNYYKKSTKLDLVIIDNLL